MATSFLRSGATRQFAAMLGICVLAVGVLLSSGAAMADSIATIKARGTLRVGAGVYPPFMIREPDGAYKGFDVDLLAEMAADLGVQLKLIDSGWDTIVAGIVTGKWDIVSGICATPKRAEVIDFSNPYLTVGGVLGVVPDNQKIKKLTDADAADVTIADIAGSWNEQFSVVAFPKAKHKSFTQLTQSDLVQGLLAGRADAAVFDAPVTSHDIQLHFGANAIRFLPSKTQPIDILPCPLSYGLPKGDAAMRTYINGFFAARKASGQLDALFKTWLESDKAND